MVRCFYTRIDKVAENDWNSIAEELIWKERVAKAMQYKAKEDYRRCIAAGMLLQRVVMDISNNYIADNLIIEKTKNGKPYFSKLNDVYFNISHSGNYVVCALGNEEVGIDVEVWQKDYMKIAHDFFAKKEYFWICNAEEHERDYRFLRMWTIKESYVKMTGVGLTRQLKEFCILPPDIKIEENQKNYSKGIGMNYSVVASDNTKTVNFCEYFIENVNIAVCSKDNIEKKVEEVSL